MCSPLVNKDACKCNFCPVETKNKTLKVTSYNYVKKDCSVRVLHSISCELDKSPVKLFVK